LSNSTGKFFGLGGAALDRNSATHPLARQCARSLRQISPGGVGAVT
jgi:hypothetical protein